MNVHTLKYFETAADRYHERLTAPLWRWQRAREERIVGELLGDLVGEDIVDLGCGSGFYTLFCLREGANRVFAVDFSPKMLGMLPKKNVVPVEADAALLKLNVKVGKIVCCGLLEFVDNLSDVLENCRNLVDEDGRMVCLVPPKTIPGYLYKVFHYSHGVKINLFSGSAFEEIVEKSGWAIDARAEVFPYAHVYRLKLREPR